MKKVYETPQITNYGNVQDITNAFGGTGEKDTFQIGNNPTLIPGDVLGLDGCPDGILIPVGNNRGR
ncbi:lasso peptide [Nostoc spongiaeforme FACHB-130]|uniref:Lasso peptide n=1 Tax=Nostoc spongiaeforme FACHB-130 TaxID=1357510 RepID=A0ABR8G0V0_9NOSO|nr:lasso peptide [Nostoc spongiaeforme]MBD2596833.1 lasso peptide [Nostoc spongiaeforme FACHB-130]